ncbi:MAG: hypothetical protein ACE10J_03070 [Thermodesulfobacteriota bacterium]
MTLKKLQEIISGSKCIRSENTRLHKLVDGVRSFYRSDQVNDHIYTNCMIERGYKFSN